MSGSGVMAAIGLLPFALIGALLTSAACYQAGQDLVRGLVRLVARAGSGGPPPAPEPPLRPLLHDLPDAAVTKAEGPPET